MLSVYASDLLVALFTHEVSEHFLHSARVSISIEPSRMLLKPFEELKICLQSRHLGNLFLGNIFPEERHTSAMCAVAFRLGGSADLRSSTHHLAFRIMYTAALF